MASIGHDQCRGIIAAMLTPLTPDERLDRAPCEALVHTLLDEGQIGLYLSGSTGEGYALDDAVRVDLFQVAAAAARSRPDRATLIAQVGGVPTRRAVALARAAADAGCDAVSAITPAGGRYSFEEYKAYYQVLAAQSPLPLFVYHIPVVTGLRFSRPQLSELLELRNVVGMKYTNEDLFVLERLVTRHPDKVLLMGADQMLAFGLLAGAVGAIGTTYNLLGPVAIRIHRAVERGDMRAAVGEQGVLNAFVEALYEGGGLRGFKALAAERFGWPSAVSPEPGLTPPPEVYAPMKRVLEAARG